MFVSFRSDLHVTSSEWWVTFSRILILLIPFTLLFSRAAADVLVSLVAIIFLVSSLVTRDRAWITSPLAIIIWLMWGWLCITGLFSAHSISDSIGKSVVFIRHPLFFLACIHMLLTEYTVLKRVMQAVLLALCVAALDGWVQYFTGTSLTGKPLLGGRITAMLDRPDIALMILELYFVAISFFLCHALLTPQRQHVNIVMTLVIAAFLGGLIMLSGQRTAMVLFLAAVGLCWLYMMIYIARWRMVLSLIALLGMACIATIVMIDPFIQQRISDLVRDIGGFGTSYYGQLIRASILLWWDYGPITGIGIESFEPLCPELLAQSRVTYCNVHAHNPYMEWLVVAGVPGLLMFITLCGMLIRHCAAYMVDVHAHDVNQQALRCSFIASLATLFVIFFPFNATMNFFSNWIATIHWFSFALACSTVRIIYLTTQSKSQ